MSAVETPPPVSDHVHQTEDSEPAGRKVRIVLAAILIPIVIAAGIGTALLWPEHRKAPTTKSLGAPTDIVKAHITSVQDLPCQSDAFGGTCMSVVAQVQSGPDAPRQVTLSIPHGSGQPQLHTGDDVTLGRTEVSPGQVTYYFSDFQRGNGLAIVAAVFAVLVVLVARWRGLGALLGLVITWFVLTEFMLPAILDGKSPLAVAIVGSSVIVFVVLYVAHGFNARTTTAVIGTLISMAVVGVLATAGVALAHITGLSSEEVSYVENFAGGVNIKGLLLGGMVIGAIGVLNDMTVTQASAVWEIHRARPEQGRLRLYRSGMRVGRDHIASTTYTLVLAYTGAALPLLIVFNLADRSFTQVVTSDVVGEEIVRTLVGGIGLILSVPITTALAAIVAKAQPVPIAQGADDDGHEDEVNPDDVIPTPMITAPEQYEALQEQNQEQEQVPEEEPRVIDELVPEPEPTPTEEPEVPAEYEPEAPQPPDQTMSKTDVILTDPTDEEQEALDAVTAPLPNKRRGLFRRRRQTAFEGSRKMTRKERKFWEED